MPYDPFYVASDEKAVPPDTKLISIRRPKIGTAELRPLEWGTAEGQFHRKRNKPEPNLQNQAQRDNRGATNQSIQKKEPQQIQQPQTEVKEVVRIVEKYIEPVTIMGVAPLVDDRIRYVVEFMLSYVNSPNVEVEAKLGVLNERAQEVRAVDVVPVLCETPIRPESNKDTRFQSDVGGDMFHFLNTRLNQRFEETTNQEHGRIQYRRTRELDIMWPGKIRETKVLRVAKDGTQTYETIRVQSKRRLGDLNVLCPGKIADVRYSASAEEDCTVPPNAVPELKRLKDRISYQYEHLSVDITHVSTERPSNPEQPPQATYEVEVEVAPSAGLYGEVVKYRNRDESCKIFEIATSMVNTVRLLMETDD
eukprot:GFKZ01003617.1.p1 GENE.GFKZ01003617.1~~GFKZ01003617.1.p1  ORF type:complete len:416 (-),score=55.67 GFKZ01003617.1:1808-2899(-)